MNRFPLYLWLLLFPRLAFPQVNELYEKYKKQHPDESAVFLHRSEILSIIQEKDSLRAFTERTEDLLILKQQAETLSSRKVYGSSFMSVRDLTARTLVWEKGKYKTLEVADFKKTSDRDQNIFFDDSYSYSFNFPAVAAQNRTQLTYTHDIKDVRFISGFIFPSYLPQERTAFTIKTSKGVELFHEILNDPQHKIQLTVTEKGGFIFYEWATQSLETMRIEDDSPGVQYYAPQVVCYVKSYSTRKGKMGVIASLDELYKWYFTFVRGLNKSTSPELNEVVQKLKMESKSELELVKKVFYWVQDNIQYIAFEEGMRGLIPHSGSYVCEKRFGDCKDMANLIVNMLGLANVKAYHTWIGTRDIPFQYTKFPTPLVDNHMIATYIDQEGRYNFLDATGDYIPFGMPTSMIQGKEALIGFDSTLYEVRLVPVIDNQVNWATDSIRVSIHENFIVGSGSNAIGGYVKSFGAYQLKQTNEDDVKKYVTRVMGKGSNKFFLDKYQVNNIDDKDSPTRIKYEFRIGDYFQKVGDEIYVNLNFTKEHYNDFINLESRKSPKESEFKYLQNNFVEFSIPAGYEVEYLPPDSNLDNAVMDYSIEYKQANNKIIYSKKLSSKFLLLQPNQFKAWNEAVTHMSEAYKESIILKKK